MLGIGDTFTGFFYSSFISLYLLPPIANNDQTQNLLQLSMDSNLRHHSILRHQLQEEEREVQAYLSTLMVFLNHQQGEEPRVSLERIVSARTYLYLLLSTPLPSPR